MCSGEARERPPKPKEKCRPTTNQQQATSAGPLLLRHGAAGPRRPCPEREWSRQQACPIFVLARGLAVRFDAQEKRFPLQRAQPQLRILQLKQIPKPELQTLPLAYRLFSLQPIDSRLEQQAVQPRFPDSWPPFEEPPGSPLG